MQEQWKDIPGYEGYYEASSLGRIRGQDRVIVDKNGFARKVEGRLLGTHLNSSGYTYAHLTTNGITKPTRVHRLIAAAFFGVSDLPIDHLNKIRTDNRPCNLEYVTSRENMRRATNKENTTSRYIGVCWHKRNKRWAASITKRNKRIHLGYFEHEADAARAYNASMAQAG